MVKRLHVAQVMVPSIFFHGESGEILVTEYPRKQLLQMYCVLLMRISYALVLMIAI